MALRARYKERFEKKHGVGARLHVLLRPRLRRGARARFPRVNAEIGGDDIVYKHYVHLGIAVGTERGLVVPVVRNAERMSFAEIEREIERLAGLARDGKLAHRRTRRRHVHDLQRRRLRLAAVDADPQPAAERHPRHAQDPEAAGRRRRPDRDPADDVRRALLRPPPGRRREAVTFLVRVKECLEDPARSARCERRDGEPSAYDLVVIGSGPGGYVGRDPRRAARHAGRLRREGPDARRHVPERRLHPEQGAARLERALSPGAATGSPRTASSVGGVELDLPTMMARKDKVVSALTQRRRGALQEEQDRRVTGAARFARRDGRGRRPRRRRRADARRATRILIATGSEPIAAPERSPFDGERIVSSTEALALPDGARSTCSWSARARSASSSARCGAASAPR